MPSVKAVDGWCEKYRFENIGAVTGKVSGVTVVDVDREEALGQAVEMFGDTPLKIRTGNGMHLYYAFNGEKTAAKIGGFDIDIRAQGGFIVLPPSWHEASGRSYTFLEGSFSLLPKLPQARRISVESGQAKAAQLIVGEIAEEGRRNASLFVWVKDRAFTCDTIEELQDNAEVINSLMMSPPLPVKEVVHTVKSVWRYKMRGCLIPSGMQAAVLSAREIDVLKDKPYALTLLAELKKMHEGLRREFNAVEEHYRDKMGWSKITVSKALAVLVERGFVEVVHHGGRYKGDKSVFQFRV